MDVILHGKINVEAVITLKTLKWEDYSGLSVSPEIRTIFWYP